MPSAALRALAPASARPFPDAASVGATGANGTSGTNGTTGTTGADGAILRLLAGTLAQPDFKAAATLLCTQLALLTGAARVVLGWRRGDRCAVVAVSNSGSLELESEQSELLGNAMLEAIDQQTPLQFPPLADSFAARSIVRAQQALARQHQGAVLTVPLADGHEAIAALVFEFAPIDPLSAPIVDLAVQAAQACAPALSLLHLRELPWHRRLLETRRLAQRQSALSAQGRTGWSGARVVGVAVAALLLAAAVLPIDRTVGAAARIEGEVQRIVASPTKGYLKAVQVRPGDPVKAGQPLAELGERDLELERNKLRSEVAQHEGGAAAALAKGDRTAMAIAQSKADEAQAQLNLIDHQLEQIRLVAPIDGVVIQGDLAQSLGAPVDRGQTLFTIAPANRYRVIVELGERDIRAARVGQAGELSLSALPWDSIPIVIRRIAPMATLAEGNNVFELEASLTGAAPDIRPGLRGTVHLADGRSTLLAIWGGRLLDNLRRWTWRWTP